MLYLITNFVTVFVASDHRRIKFYNPEFGIKRSSTLFFLRDFGGLNYFIKVHDRLQRFDVSILISVFIQRMSGKFAEKVMIEMVQLSNFCRRKFIFPEPFILPEKVNSLIFLPLPVFTCRPEKFRDLDFNIIFLREYLILFFSKYLKSFFLREGS